MSNDSNETTLKSENSDALNDEQRDLLNDYQADPSSTDNDLNTTATTSPNQTNDTNQDLLNRSIENNDTNRNKRKYDDQYENNSYNKRNNSNRKSTSNNSNSDEDVYLKLLIPSCAAGGVIGRGGEKIAQIQKDANVRMKMSKANDYYPNTNERVCLIIGSVKAVLKAHEYIIERVQEKPEAKSQSTDEERCNQIKILIPNTTAGLLIGKGGTYIKQIKDDSGAFVQISSKQTDLPERIVTIDGDADCRNKALQLVVKKISEDPQHNSVPNLNYSTMNPTNEASYASNTMNGNQSNSNKYDFNSAATYLAGLNNLALLIVNCGGSFAMTADSLKVSLRNLGYGSSAIMEIIEAITVLMSFGLITKIPPAGPNSNFPGIPNLAGNLGPGHMNNPGHSHVQHNDNRNSNSYSSHMQQQQHHHQQHHYQQHNNNHHHYNNNSNMNGNNMNQAGNAANNIGNVLQILSNTLGKVRPNKY